MDDDITVTLSDDEQSAFDHAVAAALTSRNGPSAREISTMPAWRRIAVRLLPRRQRWRLSALAPDIRGFKRRRRERLRSQAH